MGGYLQIPFTEIKAYCEFYGIDGLEERANLAKYFRRMDHEFLEVMSEKSKTDVTDAKSKTA